MSKVPTLNNSVCFRHHGDFLKVLYRHFWFLAFLLSTEQIW